MTKVEFINELREQYDYTKKDAEKAYSAVFGLLTDVVSQGEDVNVIGLGKFTKYVRHGRTARNMQTGEAIDIPDMYMPKLKFSDIVKNQVKKIPIE